MKNHECPYCGSIVIGNWYAHEFVCKCRYDSFDFAIRNFEKCVDELNLVSSRVERRLFINIADCDNTPRLP